MQQQEETPAIREPHAIPETVTRDQLIVNLQELLFALARPISCKRCSRPVYGVTSRNDRQYAVNADGSRHYPTCSGRNDDGEKKSSARPCKYCGDPIEWDKVDGRNIPMEPGTQTRHDCRDREGGPGEAEKSQVDPRQRTGAASGDDMPF
jgi:endogenous inhibitor of DNA gyrase (YacG/DUF329 family)